uniref:Integrase catalytic domain-containing protein n=1 Tax=Fagus sylvatica TaxID=28930 RepID=A0A2N9HNB4_FAGSY
MAPGSRGVSELFLCTFPMRIPVKRGMLSANREFHDVAGVIIFPTHPGSRINLLRAGKTLRAKAAVREKKCVLLPARFFSNLVPVPDSRESELGLVRYGPASRVHRGVFGPFEGSFPIRIPADPDKFLAIREFHVVHGCVLFPMCPGSQINLLRVRKTLCASVATSALHRGEFGFARYDPANGGRRNVPYAKGGGQFDPVFGLVNGPVKPWSNLVNLGQTWSNLVKALQTLGNVSRTSFQGFLGKADPSRAGKQLVFDADEPSSDQTGLVRAVSFCVPTPEKIPGRQDEGSKPNIEELEIVNLANEGEEPREVKIGTHYTTEQKEALIALLREFHEIFAWSYQDMPGLDTDIVVHKIPLKPECKPVKQALRRMKPESHFEDQGRGGKAIEGRFPKHSNLFGLGSQYSPGAEEGRKTTNVVFSFMDGFSGYNQIKMAEEDKSKTAFITHWGTFVYDVMPFGLKNAGATYQRAMVTLFHDMIHHEIEVYVDDMIAKSRTAQDHLTDLRKLFQRLKKYQLRLNPNKCAFGVTSGKLLGFIVSGRGIEIDPAKVQAIRSMPAPKTEKEIRSFLGRINYVARFIAQLTATCEPLFKLLRKDVKIKWTEDCQRAFDKIKEYLLNPPILVPPTPGRPLILYLTVQEASMGCMLGQQDETGKKEQAIYYLSKKFTEPETRYLLVEKTCCALAWASKKLRQYMLYYTTWLVSRMDPIKYIFEKPALTGKIARWQITHLSRLELMDSEFPDEDVMTVDEDNHGRWKLYFDGAANAVGSGIGAVLVSPKGQQTPIAVKLGFDCTNNMTEYEACIVGLQAALEFGAYELEVFGDSLLIVSQTNGEWQARDPKLIPYPTIHQPANPKVQLVEGDDVRPLRIETRDILAYCVCIEECMNVEAEIDDKPWYYDIKRFIQDRERCTRDLMGAHANGPFLARKIMRAGYYWLTMERDCIRHVQTCHKCQMYQNSKNAPPQYLHTMASPWPFSAWGMDVIGAITPKASNGHEFILVAIDYFTKWVEACSFKNVTQVAVTRFVKNNIICRYGMPEMLITDNASNLNNRMMDQLCQQFKIQHHNSAPYRPKMNGAVEAANKNVKKILSKMT